MDFLIKPGRIVDFMSMRRISVIVSLLLVVASAVLLFTPGPKLGIDFSGGTEITVRFDKNVEGDAVRASLVKQGHTNPDVIKRDNPANTFIIRVKATSTIKAEDAARYKKSVADALGGAEKLLEFRVTNAGDAVILQLAAPKEGDRPLNAEMVTALVAGSGLTVRPGTTAKMLGNETERRWRVDLRSIGDEIFDKMMADVGSSGTLEASNWVSPRAAKDLLRQAIRAIVYSLIFIMIYVAFRFDLRFAPGGMLVLFHDAMVILGFFVISRKEITISTVAAILTVIGYSMNETIIVYDRVRENVSKRRGLRMVEVINLSVTEMFSRTLKTALTVILSMIPFVVLASGMIADFAAAMIVGVCAGTYSSIYVAAPLAEWIDSRFFHPGNKPAAGAKKPAGASAPA